MKRISVPVGFGARLLLAGLLTVAVAGTVGYLLMARQLRTSQIADYAGDQQSDARSLETIGRREGATLPSLATIGDLLDAIGQRPGTLDVVLIGPRSIVIASGTDTTVVGTRVADPRIARGLRHDIRFSGLEAVAGRDGRDFEFVAPLQMPDGRYVLRVRYDDRVLDEDFGTLRRTLALIGWLALVAGAAVFYLVGGRTLLRSHRIALERATRDGLTDLPNHRAFQHEFPRAVRSATDYHEPLAIVVLDVDDFKFLNDHHGNSHGDAILRRVAGALRSARPEDRTYRIGDDEFVLLLPDTDGEGAATIATRLARALGDMQVVVSMGVSDLRRGQSAEDLRAEAAAALTEAKRRGGRRVVHFDEIREQTVITTSARTDLVRRLIDEASLSMVFQPIWDLESERLLGVEALMRPHPASGLAHPAEAFDLAQQIGRVHDLDVLCACRALSDVPQLPAGALLFINLSPQTLELDAGDGGWLRAAAERAGIAPSRVVLEVTERFGARTDAVVTCLRRLRGEGFRVALDDVGTGNSGLEMLQKINADFVKIDRGIVLAAATDRSARAVLMAMATYARQTGSYVIAEGIEDRETLDFLDSIDERDGHPDRTIQGGQGFGLGRPAVDGAAAGTPELLARTLA